MNPEEIRRPAAPLAFLRTHFDFELFTRASDSEPQRRALAALNSFHKTASAQLRGAFFFQCRNLIAHFEARCIGGHARFHLGNHQRQVRHPSDHGHVLPLAQLRFDHQLELFALPRNPHRQRFFAAQGDLHLHVFPDWIPLLSKLYDHVTRQDACLGRG